MRIAITGATGFIGSALAHHLAAAGHEIAVLSRAQLPRPDLTGADAVVHCAGLAHRSGRQAPSEADYARINVDLAVTLGRAAMAAGVGRFVQVSTINVIAGHPLAGPPLPLTPQMSYRPASAYGQSKAEAEQSLLATAELDVVVARPALVYGSGAPGNLRRLMRLVRAPVPLPFGLADAPRSMVSLSNAVRALAYLATADRAALSSRIYHLADPQPLSTRTIVATARAAIGRSPLLLPVPPRLVEAALCAIGKAEMAAQLFGELIVDGSALVRDGFVYQDGIADLQDMARVAAGRQSRETSWLRSSHRRADEQSLPASPRCRR